MAGKDAGQVGTVTKVIRDVRFPRVLVEGLNLVRLSQHAAARDAAPALGCLLALTPAAHCISC